MTVQEALNGATVQLREGEIASPRLDSEVLLRHILHYNKTELYLNYDRELTVKEEEAYGKLIKARLSRVPVAYLVGKKEFMALDFHVDQRVLIPRPETELLVEAVLAASKDYPSPVKVLDLGTGSGAIALSIAFYNAGAQVFALDISAAALAVARENAQRLGVERQVEFWQGDLWAGVPEAAIPFSLIVSNPPYIGEGEMEHLEKEVTDYEPTLALTAGSDGLDLYRRISTGVAHYLAPGGLLALEVGQGQAQRVQHLLEESKTFSTTKILLDYAGIARIVLAWRKNK